jgi:hypothetical protein
VDLLIKRDEIHETRIDESAPRALAAGEALLAIESFGLTANNITYAVMGEAMGYWEFFPSGSPGWGLLPAWGFASVVDPGDTGLTAGMRVFGYVPASSHLVVSPSRAGDRGFVDAALHRATLPSAYQRYRAVGADPAYAADREDEQMLFWPLFYTSWLIDDFLGEAGMFGADAVIVSSASSKTGLIAAYMLARRGAVDVIGLTSRRNRPFVERVGVYDSVSAYDEVAGLDRRPSVYVDMSGNGRVRRAVRERLGAELRYDCAVGASHWDRLDPGSVGELPGPSPVFFFAPDQIEKRGGDWSPAGLEERVVADWHPFVEWAAGWLEVDRGTGPEALSDAYASVLRGTVEPARAHVIVPRG